MTAVRLVIVGTGFIGRQHARHVVANPGASLVGVSGLDEASEGVAMEHDVPFFRDYRRLVDLQPDGVIVATPNSSHREVGAFFADHGAHLLIEKPVTHTVAAGKDLCEVAERNGVQLLVGHQRRHNNLVKKAADLVATEIGQLVASNTVVLMRKPDSYFELDWRRTAGAGPLLINLIHDVDLLRAVCGEIDFVQAVATKRVRAYEFFDTSAILLGYRNGAVGTVVISDAVPSPWNWEASVSEGLGFPTAGQDHAVFGGSEASLSFPSLTLWSYDSADGEMGWNQPIHRRSVEVEHNNPYLDQITNFVEVIGGIAPPIVSGRDGLRSLAVVEAVTEAAATGRAVNVGQFIADA